MHKIGTKRALEVLVIDDSALVREVMVAILTQQGGMNVTVAADGVFAMRKIAKKRPDVIVLDLEMPRMDGHTFMQLLMARDPIPVVICSSQVGGTDAAIRALEEGAVDVVAKPRLGVRHFLEDSAIMLSDAVRAAARSGPKGPIAPKPLLEATRKLTADAVLPPPAEHPRHVGTQRIVAIGASTGGTEAVADILQAMPIESDGIVVVQHMPAVFTEGFAKRLNETCNIDVAEARDGDRVTHGRALIAPGNKHMLVERSGSRYVAKVQDGPLVSRHRPSVDVLFRSVARAAGPNATGVILTGMGDDGAQGLLEMRQAGAATIAQDEASSVVFGMPKEAIARGAVDKVVPLSRVANSLLA